MSGGGRRGNGEGGRDERFADQVGDDVTPLRDRDARHAPPRPPPGPRRAPGPPPVAFVREAEGRGRAADVAARILAKLARGDPAPERELDLHGLDARAAEEAVRRAVLDARAAGARCLRVVHGRGRRSPGEPVLRAALPEWLERPPLDRLVLAWSRAPERLGGDGASLVLLRRERARRPRGGGGGPGSGVSSPG